MDLVDRLAATLQDETHRAQRHGGALVLGNGLVLQPQIVEFQPRDSGAVQSCTTIQANHPSGFPGGVFEFQHSAGDTLDDAITKGFQAWAQGDLPVLMDTLLPKPKACTCLELDLPAQSPVDPLVHRRVVLGPPLHIRFTPKQTTPESPPADPDADHDFCPCCLFTKSLDAFQSLLSDGAFHGLRLYAARDPRGEPMADCRVDGVPWPAGVAALRRYVETWPGGGFEARKQFVVIQTTG